MLVFLIGACGAEDEGRPAPPAQTPSPEIAATVELRVDVGRATVFSRPDRNAAVIYNLVEGDTIAAAGRSEPDALGTLFFAIRVGDTFGWIAETQVEVIEGEAEALLVIPDDSFVEENGDGGTGVAQSDDPATPEFQVFVVAQVENAPIYDTASLDAPVIDSANMGDQLEVRISTSVDESGLQFFGVALRDRLAWVSNIEFEVIGNLDIRPQLDLNGEDSSPTATLFSSATATTSQVQAETPTLTATTTQSPANNNNSSGAPTLPPESTTTPSPSPSPTFTPDLSATPSATSTPPTIREAEPPLLTLDLPPGWEELHLLVPIESAYAEGDIIMSVYEGPLAEGSIGHIWILWRFFRVLPSDDDLSLFPEGLLYLRSLLFSDCNIGVFPENRMNYSIGGQEAVGTIFSAVDCSDGSADVAGWFATLNYEGENYAFYMAVEPAEAYQDARNTLRDLIQTVRFIPLAEYNPQD